MKEDIIKELKTVYDPEMPSVDVFNLGLIYDIDIKEATERVAGEGNVKIILTHTPPFSRDMLSEEAKLILNL